MKTIRIIVGMGMLLMYARGQAATPLSACPIQGEVIHWVADYCMFKFETDDEIAVSDCIADQIKIGAKNECTAKANYKRALCELTIKSGATRGNVEQCVADRTFMGNTVRNGGVGAQR